MSYADYSSTRFAPELVEKSFDSLSTFPMLAAIKIQDIRKRQREEGNFDCFARASSGYCDQTGCKYHDECVELSLIMPGLEPL